MRRWFLINSKRPVSLIGTQAFLVWNDVIKSAWKIQLKQMELIKSLLPFLEKIADSCKNYV